MLPCGGGGRNSVYVGLSPTAEGGTTAEGGSRVRSRFLSRQERDRQLGKAWRDVAVNLKVMKQVTYR